MFKRSEKFLRTFAIPLGATALAILFWNEHRCAGAVWFLILIGAIFIIHYFFFFRRYKKIAD